MKSVLLIFLLCTTLWSLSSTMVPERGLEVNDELLEATKQFMEKSHLTLPAAVKRVESLIDSVDTLKDKCNKYMFVVKNYVSFYQERSTQKLQEELRISGRDPNSMHISGGSSLGSDQFQTKMNGSTLGRNLIDEESEKPFVQPTVRQYGSIPNSDANFDNLMERGVV